MFATIWMCTHEWSLISIRATALTLATCHQPLTWSSLFTRSITVRSFLFAGTVAENVAFGRPSASPEQIVQAAQAVGAHDFILRLEDGYENDDAEVVVLLGALTHCIGMAVHREGHEDFSLFLAEPKQRELLKGLYDEPELTVVASEVLHAITSHREYGRPLTLEAGIVRVADALDMAKGRSRIPFERGRVSIHSLSAAAIDDVTITDGLERPIGIEISMNNSSGIYQVDELLGSKLRGSGLEPYVDVIAHIEGEAEKLLLPTYRLET